MLHFVNLVCDGRDGPLRFQPDGLHMAELKAAFRNGPVDVKDSVFTLKNPGTDEGFRGACQAQ
ncbi:hypothetical protein [Candidatus Rhodobacter oscarellae]|uniref:hypothetical protein n=1 Tax=Candidatus Rhodobacter oscarellae TaxID=1675527 RepID=UPI0006709B66|nr:hypothetical protein [Candidatus Rhodobacter lobularis]